MNEENIDLSGAVDMIKNMLSNEEGQAQIQNILGMLGEGQTREQSPGIATGGIDPENLDMMLKIQKALSLMNSQKNSGQAQLLMALKPFLKPSRQKKVDSAMKLLKFSSVMEIMREAQGE